MSRMMRSRYRIQGRWPKIGITAGLGVLIEAIGTFLARYSKSTSEKLDDTVKYYRGQKTKEWNVRESHYIIRMIQTQKRKEEASLRVIEHIWQSDSVPGDPPPEKEQSPGGDT